MHMCEHTHAHTNTHQPNFSLQSFTLCPTFTVILASKVDKLKQPWMTDRKGKLGREPSIGLTLGFGRIIHCNLKILKMFLGG